ncbi:MAG: alpha/beta fold hydrolase, partial [Janthinobacterium lividum]
MLPVRREGERGPLLVMLHWLGGGAQTWTEVSHGLAGRGVRCAALDLPGFGEASGTAGYTVAAMADAVAETIKRLRAEPGFSGSVPWLIAGHSMGGKIAGVVARRALDGEPGLEDLRGIVLVSASPPSPEPMSDSKRGDMLQSLGESTDDPTTDRKHAEKFVDENTGKLPLPGNVRERAIEGVLGMNRTAFRRWLELGSNEDWGSVVGQVRLPALLFAGTEDGALGPKAQRELTLPHFPEGELVTLEHAGHLAPLERPGELVERLTQFIANTGISLTVNETKPGSNFEHLLHSDRVSPHTREAMEARLGQAQHWNHEPGTFTPAEFRTLRALAERLLPNAGLDLAACVDAEIGKEAGDGWRYAALPPDTEAWHRGLLSLDSAAQRLHGVSFVSLFPKMQDALIEQATAGKLGKGLLGTLHVGDAADAFSANEMRLWFEEVRGMYIRFYVGDPRTMERMGYTGFADDLGFTQIKLGQQEE